MQVTSVMVNLNVKTAKMFTYRYKYVKSGIELTDNILQILDLDHNFNIANLYFHAPSMGRCHHLGYITSFYSVKCK